MRTMISVVAVAEGSFFVGLAAALRCTGIHARIRPSRARPARRSRALARADASPPSTTKIEHPNSPTRRRRDDARGKTGLALDAEGANGFYPVLDGLCSKLGMGRVGRRHHRLLRRLADQRGEHERALGHGVLHRAKDSGLRVDRRSRHQLPTGLAGISRRRVLDREQHRQPELQGAVLHQRRRQRGRRCEKDRRTFTRGWTAASSARSAWRGRTTTTCGWTARHPPPPNALWEGFHFPDTLRVPHRRISLLVQTGEGKSPWAARHWAPGKKITQHAAWFEPGEWPPLSSRPRARRALRVRQGRRRDVRRHDLEAARQDLASRQRRAWAKRAGKASSGCPRERQRGACTPTQFVTVALPRPLRGEAASTSGAPWRRKKSGKPYKRKAGCGRRRDAAAVPGLATAVKARTSSWARPTTCSSGGVLGEGSRLDGQSSLDAPPVPGLQKETMRCRARTGATTSTWARVPVVAALRDRGVQDAVRGPLRAGARRSQKVPTENDWKARSRRRAQEAAGGNLGDSKLVELVSGDRTFLGAKAKDLEHEKKLATLAAAGSLRPEVVCSGRPRSREIPLD